MWEEKGKNLSPNSSELSFGIETYIFIDIVFIHIVYIVSIEVVSIFVFPNLAMPVEQYPSSHTAAPKLHTLECACKPCLHLRGVSDVLVFVDKDTKLIQLSAT